MVLVMDCAFRAEVYPTGNGVVQNLVKQYRGYTEVGQKGKNKAQAGEVLKAKWING